MRRLFPASVAAAIILVTFPDIIFGGKSFRPSEIGRDSPLCGIRLPVDTMSSYVPEPPWRHPCDQFRDLGASLWQLEPATAFMARVMRTRDSPYWNPYQACGALGVETMADSKTSVFTLLTAAFGTSSGIYHAVRLIIIGAGIAFLFAALRTFFGLSALAATTASLFFLMNGFAMGNLNAQMSHGYFLAPVCLYGMAALAARPAAATFIGAVAAHLLMLSETFIPVVFLAYVGVGCLTLAFVYQHVPAAPARRAILVAQAAAVALAVVMLAPIWLPTAFSLKYTYAMTRYNLRPGNMGATLAGLLSLFTPKHFWETYQPHSAARFPDMTYEINNICHLGIVASLIAVYPFYQSKNGRNIVLWTAAALFLLALLRIYSGSLAGYIRYLPVIRSLWFTYWFCLSSLAFVFLLAYGVDALRTGRAVPWMPAILAGVILSCLAYLSRKLGMPEDNWYRLYLLVALALVLGGLTIILAMRFFPRAAPALRVMLVLLAAGEMHFYMNHMRPARSHPDEMPPLARFLQQNLDGHRFLNVGRQGVMANWGSTYGLEQIENVNTLALAWFEDFFRRYIHDSPHESFLQVFQPEPFNLDERALDLLSVKYVLIPNGGPWVRHADFFTRCGYRKAFEKSGMTVFENPDPMPRAFLASHIVRGSLELDKVPETAPVFTEDETLLSQAAEMGISDAPGPAAAPAPARITEYRNSRVVVRCNAVRPSVLVLTDTWHPGWHAELDGSPVHMARVNDAFRGLLVPPGPHELRFYYRPPGWRAAAAATLSALLVMAALVVFRRWLDAWFSQLLAAAHADQVKLPEQLPV